MIKTLELRNFQGHRQSSFNFSPGVNVIKGTSHNGKTSIIRAIYWALFNRPSVGVVRNWYMQKNDEVKVAIEFDNGFVIRKSSKDFNGYVLPDEEFDAIGKSVPEEVGRLANLGEVNLQGQHDKYFMIQEGPQVAAQKLNQIVGLEIIDQAMSRAVNEVSGRKNEIQSSERIVEQHREDLKSYLFLDSLEPLMERIEKNLARSEQIGKRIARLEVLKDQIVDLRKDDRRLNEFLTVEVHYDRLMEKSEEYSKIVRRIGLLRNHYNYACNMAQQLRTIEDQLLIEYPVDVLTNLQERIVKIQNRRAQLQKLHESIVSLRNHKIDYAMEVRQLEKEYQEEEKSLFDSGICPTCGQKVERGTCAHEIEDNQSNSEGET